MKNEIKNENKIPIIFHRYFVQITENNKKLFLYGEEVASQNLNSEEGREKPTS